MSLTNFSVTRETLDKLVEVGFLERFDTTTGASSYYVSGGGNRLFAEILKRDDSIKDESQCIRMTHQCFAEIEKRGWQLITRPWDEIPVVCFWEKYPEGSHGARRIAEAPTLPEALAKALT